MSTFHQRYLQFGGAPLAILKRYKSIRQASSASIGEAMKIVLSSSNPKYRDIEIQEGDEIQILGIFERVITR